jgi:hypothetical protein
LAEYNLEKPVKKVSYWYLDRDDEPVEKTIPDLSKTLEILKERAQTVLKTVASKQFHCSSGQEECRYCQEYNKVIKDQAEHVATDYKRKREVFFLQ